MDTFILAEDNPPSSTDVSIHERQAALARNTKPTLFKLKAQLLDQGRTDTVLAATDALSLRLKVYAEGGENELHAHPHEDHFFVVLAGAAEFHGPSEETVIVRKNEGLMMPKGNLYWFVHRHRRRAAGDAARRLAQFDPTAQDRPHQCQGRAHGRRLQGEQDQAGEVQAGGVVRGLTWS